MSTRLHEWGAPDCTKGAPAATWCRILDANQLGRRNLTPDGFKWILGRRYNRTKKARGGDRGNQYTVAKDQIDPLPNTATKLAKEHGVSEPTVKRAGKFADEVESARDADCRARDGRRAA
jgi:hypothetical protein